jgi:Berberine and berberine like
MNWSVGRALNTEANVSIPAEIQRGFWGANYPRLLDIKRSRDPAGVLRVHHGADSEEP